MTKCIFCGKEFEISIKGAGLKNRIFCYDCCPLGLSPTDRAKLQQYMFYIIAKRDKIARGCDICGYNTSSYALEWHHPNGDKDNNPSEILYKKGYHAYLEEIKKCQLLCANCHRELHEKELDNTKHLLNKIQNYRDKGYTPEVVTTSDIIEKYQEGKSITEVAKTLGVDRGTVSKILHDNNINTSFKKIRPVKQIDKNNGEVLNTFNNAQEALLFLNKPTNGSSHVYSVCEGKRKTAYGYRWEYDLP